MIHRRKRTLTLSKELQAVSCKLQAACNLQHLTSKRQVESALRFFAFLLIASFALGACAPQPGPGVLAMPAMDQALDSATTTLQPKPDNSLATPLPTRPLYSPGELVDYTAQTGDNIPALAVRFNTSIDEIMAANSFIPKDVTTLPPGMPMKIPIYYAPLWGSPYQILPDGLFVDGPAQVGFDTAAFVESHPGWLKNYSGFSLGETRSGAQTVDLVALNYSISPRLLLALLEYQSGALSQPEPPAGAEDYALGKVESQHKGLYLQLAWASDLLNDGYYRYRMGEIPSIIHRDGTLERPDPWQNAASVALQNYFSQLLPVDQYYQAISQDGFASTYRDLFGDPWATDVAHIPGSLTQPQFNLPFEPGKTWAFTGGPHTGWGNREPWSALDFAPPSVVGGCATTDEWATAVAPGIVARSEPGVVVLDLDGDGDERTGWTVFHLHVATEGRVPAGVSLKAGDPIGHPSCEEGKSTGTHIHIARKYNGEWIPAYGVLAFNLDGWISDKGAGPYQGTLSRFGKTVVACVCSNGKSFITAETP